MTTPIPFIDLKAQYAGLKDAIDARIHAVLDHGQFIMGPEIAELEAALATYTGSRHCITVASGTEALLIALMALGIGPGDEVITTPFTFAATVEVILLAGATPVLVDIDPVSYNIRPDLIEAAISPATKAIMPVSLYGQCADMDAINAIAAVHGGIPVIEDAAQSFGATYKGRKSCALSTFGCTSFFPSKPLGCYGDGGAIFTDDDALAQAAREIRVHGQSKRYHHTRIGVGGRLDTIQAAILLAKLDSFPAEVAAREAAGARYISLFSDVSGVAPPVLSEGNTSVWGQFTLRAPHRDAVLDAMKAGGVPSAIHYPVPLHKQPAYEGKCRIVGSLAESERASAEVVQIPMHPFIDEETQKRVAGVIAAGLAS